MSLIPWTISSSQLKVAAANNQFGLCSSKDAQVTFGSLSSLFLNQIYDGSTTSATRIGTTYCGYDIPDQAISTSNTLLLTFHTDYSVTRTGFLATYSFFLSKLEIGLHFFLHKVKQMF